MGELALKQSVARGRLRDAKMADYYHRLVGMVMVFLSIFVRAVGRPLT